MRVLHVIGTLGMGGAETWLMEVLRLWSRNGTCQLDFLATSGNSGVFDEEARQLGAKIHYVHYERAGLRRFAEEFRKILREGKYHAIHDHQDHSSGWHFLMGGSLLPPLRVTHVHGPAFHIRDKYGVTLRRRLTARIGKGLIARYATHITGTSRQAITEYGFDVPRFRRIPKAALYCGLNPARFLGNTSIEKISVCRELGWPEDAKIILFGGRIDHSPNIGHPQNHKNSGFAVSVGIECLRRDERMRMILAGLASPAVPLLEQRIAMAGLGGRIQFLGIRKDIERLMLASDVLLFPSRGEGLGMVAVEAQAAGLPVLASDAVPRECVVVPELVRFQTVEAGQRQWADELLRHVAQRRNVADANRRVAASAFAIENSARSLLMLYSNAASS
jgi:glycosyltransferase EpsF